MDLRSYRERAGITQWQLASRLGYSTAQFISNVENKKARLPLKAFRATAKILGVKLEDLLNDHIAEDKERLARIFKVKL